MCPTILRNFCRLLLFLSLWLVLLVAWQRFAFVQAQDAPTMRALNQTINNRIAYATTHRHGEYRIYVVNQDGSGHFELVAAAGSRRPAWSADGAKLAFERSSNIYVINADGSGLQQLTTDNRGNTLPSWSPDGTRLAFVKNNDLHTMNADGTQVRKLTSLSSFFFDVAWSPDGAKLLFIVGGRLQTCLPDGSGTTNVLQQSLNVTSAAWSPDNAQIVLTTGSGFPGGGAIRIANADGTGLRNLTNGATDLTPVFSPDATKIAFVRGTELFTMNVDGSHAAKVPDTHIGAAISIGNGATVNPGLSWQRLPDAPALPAVISGRVTDEAGQGLAGKVEINGGGARTDREGYYSLGNLAAGDYIVGLNPVFFTPVQSVAVSNLTGDYRQDFVAQQLRYTISGRVTDNNNAPLRGVPVVFRRSNNQSSAEDSTTVTDENGFYRLSNLPPRDGTEAALFSVSPLVPYARFQPLQFAVPRLTEDLTVNFVGTRLDIPISGRVVDAEERGIGGVTITLSGARNRTVTTNADGRFDLGAALGGLDYTVTATKEGLTFVPPSRNLKELSFSASLLFRSGISLLMLVSPATLQGGPLASEAMVTAFGANLATTTATAGSLLGETQLGGVRAEIEDGSARGRPGLLYVSPTQINLNLYFWSGSGESLITIYSTATNRVIAAGAVELARIAPALFAANNNGAGVAAAVALRVRPGNRQTYEPVIRFDNELRQFVAVPLDTGAADEELFLVLYGLGVKNRSSLEAVKCQIGGVDAPVTYAGRAPNFFGLEQVNVRLPRELMGRGEVDIVLTIEGKTANTVSVAIK